MYIHTYIQLLCSCVQSVEAEAGYEDECLTSSAVGRRKVRSETSDNMDRSQSRGGKSRRREEKKREDQRRERVRRKNMQAREKVEKSRFTVFSNDLWLHGRKIGWLKRRVRSPGQMRD